MNKFMAIVKKDWQLHRRAILMQAWLVLGMWALTALAGTIIYFSILHYHPERIDISSSNFSLMWESMNNIVIYGLNFYQVILPTLMGLIFSISILIGALNSDMRHNCEIFYRTQPVSLWWRAASKYKVGLFFTLAVTLGLTLVQYGLSNLILFLFTHHADWWLGFVGTMQYYFHMFFVTILCGSLAFFFSAVFKEHTFFRGAGLLLLLAFLIVVINLAFEVSPIIFNGYQVEFRIPGMYKILFGYPIAGYSISNDPTMDLGRDLNSLAQLKDTILFRWKLIFGWDTLVKVAVSAGLFFAGTWLYIRKEVL